MAELPEVETIRRQLEREVVGKKVKTIDVHDTKGIRRHGTKKQFATGVEGAKLKSLKRRGTYLVFNLDTGEHLVLSLGDTGRVHKVPSKEELAKETLISFEFTQGGQLRLLDAKKQAEMFVVSPDDVSEVFPELADMGLDVVDSPVPLNEFARMVLGRSMKLKALLTDREIIAGIGAVYADEILYEAGLRHDRMSDEISVQEVRRLYRAVVEVLHEGVKYGGTSLTDDDFRDLHGDAGGYVEYHRVYARDGQPCRRCRGTISKVKFQKENTYICEQCQV